MAIEDKRDEQLRQALFAIKTLQARLLDASSEMAADPIAIVGMDCRFPGANSPEALWQTLLSGEHQVGTVPDSRWEATGLYDQRPDQPGKMYTQAAGTMAEVDAFDNEFFGISPHEALALDPQQRVLLEVCWHALEDAQLAPARLAQTRTGVFVALSNNDYGQRRLRANHPEQIEAYDFTGNILSTAAGRISYVFDLLGPNLVVDTACSSSLVAVHLACQSLRNGESDLALAAGVNLILDPAIHIALSRAKALSPDGACKTFDAQANGYARSEGCAVVVLKRLADARRDGDPVLALIQASGVNQDGRSNGLTAPNGQAQEQLLRDTLRRAQLAPADIAFIETHGTGTALGDPIEVDAIKRVYAAASRPLGPLLLGAVKSNIGHLEAAAGLAGLLKTVLSLRYRMLPGNLHFHTPNPLIAWDDTIRVPTVATLLTGARLAAGVSSFGISGTNAHLVVQEALPPAEAIGPRVGTVLLPVSAKSAAALRELLPAYEAVLARADLAALADVAAVAARGRNHFPFRKALVAGSAEEMLRQLATAGRELTATGSKSVAWHQGEVLRVAFLFTGQGAQYGGMGVELYATEPTFRAAWDACEQVLANWLDRPLKSVVFDEAEAGLLSQTAWTQPALFVLEYCLAQLWQSWGIRPAVVGGHSLGEYVAACLAGVFSLDEALHLVVRRAALMLAVAEPGTMFSVFAAAPDVQPYIVGHESVISIAAFNGAQHTVVSGAAGPLAAVVAQLAEAGFKSRQLPVSHAFHSPLMMPVVAEFRQALAVVHFHPAQLPVLSNLSGGVAGPEISTPDYWVAHLLAPVRFHENIATLATLDCQAVVELGPQPVLLAMAADALPADLLRVVSLRRGIASRLGLLRGLGALYEAGAHISWEAVVPPAPARPVPMPRYPFARNRFWLENARPALLENPVVVAPDLGLASPFAGQALSLPGTTERRFGLTLRADHPVSLRGHQVFGQVMLPGAAYVEMLLQVAHTLGLPLPLRIANLRLTAALTLRETTATEVQLVLRPEPTPAGTAADYGCEIFSRPTGAGTWVSHATAMLGPASAAGPAAPPVPNVTEAMPIADFYVACEAVGISYAELFQSLTAARCWPAGATGLVRPAPAYAAELSAAQLHPALLDCAFQTLGTVLLREHPGKTFLPVGIDELVFMHPATGAIDCVVQHEPGLSDDPVVEANLWLATPQGQAVAFVRGIKLLAVTRNQIRAAVPELPEAYRSWLYTVAWPAQPLPAAPAALPTPAALLTAVTQRLAGAVAHAHEVGYADLLTGLDTLSVAYVREALATLGISLTTAGEVLLTGLGTRLGVLPRYERLLRRCLVMLAEQHLVELTEEVLRWPATPGQPSADVLSQLPDGPETALLASCGPHLAAVLLGAQDPLQLLFPAGDASAIRRLYRDSTGFEMMQAAVGAAGGGLAETLAIGAAGPARPLRILEIGAGTGSSTRALLPALAGVEYRYVFTDVSRLFLGQAAEELAKFAGLTFQVLDIEKNPIEQGFTTADFDVIVASNVLHATANLSQTFAHVRQLLRPGGLLLLSEGTEQFYWTDLTFGLTDGWWRFDDLTLRPAHPLLSEHTWRTFLARQGFGTVTAFTPHGPAGEVLAGQSLLLGCYAPTAAPSAATEVNWLIDLTGQAQATDWANVLPALVITSGVANRPVDPLANVVVLLGASTTAAPVAADLAEATKTACNQVLGVIQDLLRAGGTPPTGRLLLLVDSGYAAGLPAAALLALRRVIAHEHPELHPGYLAVSTLREAPAALRTELATGQLAEQEVRYQGGERQVARLQRLPVSATPPETLAPAYQPAATYLITGGLGGLGRLLARQLAANGAGRLVLLGRSAPDAATLREIAQMRQAGTTVEVVLADVSDATQMADVFQHLDQPGHPLRGVIHAAGVVADAALARQSPAALATVFAAKVHGGWNVHQLSQGRELDFFVLFGSSASVLGPAGQASHAAANGFLDGLAAHRQQQGLPGVSIAWGPWATAGAALHRGVGRRLETLGLESIASEPGLRAFEALRAQPVAAVTVVKVRWTELDPSLQLLPLMSGLLANDQAPKPSPMAARLGRPVAVPLRELLQRAAPAQHPALLAEHIHHRVREILGFNPEKQLDFRQGLFELGMDSLTAISLKNSLQVDLDCILSTTLVFKYPSIGALADYLGREYLTPAPAAAAGPTPITAAIQAEATDFGGEVADLTDEELALLVADELNRLAL